MWLLQPSRNIGAAGGRASIDPRNDPLDLLVAEAPVVLEITELRIGRPRWHPPRLHHFLDRRGPRPRIAVRQQRHRCDLARTMTRHAAVEENRRDVLVEG